MLVNTYEDAELAGKQLAKLFLKLPKKYRVPAYYLFILTHLFFFYQVILHILV
jgi:hypothetical protein